MSMGGYGMAAQAIGNELQGWATVMAQRAMERQYRDALNRGNASALQALKVVGTGINAQSQPGFDAWRQQGADSRIGAFNRLAGVQLGTQPVGQGSLQREAALSSLLAGTRANLLGYGDAAFQRSLQDMETQRKLARIIDAARGQSSVDPYRMYKAQHSMDKLRMAGESISSLGGGAANYGQYLQNQKTPEVQQQTVGFSESANPEFEDAYGTKWGKGWSGMTVG